MAERRQRTGEKDDLLAMLVCAHDTDGDGSAMNETQLVDECVTLLLAGHETTASALTFAFYLLSKNPLAEAQLHAELAQVLGGRPPSAEDLPRLVYTEQVFAETLRLYPSAWMMGRFLTAPARIGGRDYAAGSLLVTSQYTMQRDARFFPEPLRFAPERFSPQARATRPKAAFFPFGAGPRQCIGEGFAWMEGTLLLATLAQQLTFRLVPGQRVEPEALLTLRPKYGMRMEVHCRAPSAPPTASRDPAPS
jgi:cytochrome P450